MMQPGRAPKLAAAVTLVFMVALFFQMMRTLETHRWRRYFFVALGFLFPVGFIWDLFALRGSMSIPVERMLSGDTPFCFLAIPMMIVPAALTRTVIFPGSILPTASNPHAIAAMVALWLAATLVLGKGWCSYGCFFGGIEEGFAAIPKKPRIQKHRSALALDAVGRAGGHRPAFGRDPRARLLHVALPVQSRHRVPRRCARSKRPCRRASSSRLFLGLVVVLPLLTKKRTQCSFLCPFGAFQSHLQQDRRFRRAHRPLQVQALRPLREGLPHACRSAPIDRSGQP